MSARAANFLELLACSGHGNYAEKRFTQIYRDLYGDAILVPMRMGTNMAAGNQQKICHWVSQQKREFISRGT